MTTSNREKSSDSEKCSDSMKPERDVVIRRNYYANRSPMWRVMSVMLNILALILMACKSVGPGVDLFNQKNRMNLYIEDVTKLVWQEELVYDATCNDLEADGTCHMDIYTVTFNDKVLCDIPEVSSNRTFEGVLKYPRTRPAKTYASYVGYVCCVAFIFVKLILQLVNIWPPCSRLTHCIAEVIGFFCGLGLCSPLLLANPCPNSDFSCSISTVKCTLKHPFCKEYDDIDQMEGIAWILTVLASLIVVFLLALSETRWMKKYFGAFRGGFNDLNLRRNRFLFAAVCVFGIIAIIDLGTFLTEPLILNILCILAAGCLVLDNLMQYFFISDKYRLERSSGILKLRKRKSFSDESSSILEEQCRVVSCPEIQTNALDVPERLVFMMADENKIARTLYDFDLYTQITITLSNGEESAPICEIEASTMHGARPNYRKFKLGLSPYVLDSAAPEESTSVGNSYYPDHTSNMEYSSIPCQEKCLTCLMKYRTILFEPCRHFVYCRECFTKSLNVKRSDVEQERHRISRRISTRHRFIRACFKKLSTCGFSTSDLNELKSGNVSFAIPESERFTMRCPICRERINRVLSITLLNLHRSTFRGSVLHLIDYTPLEDLILQFETRKKSSDELLEALIAELSMNRSISNHSSVSFPVVDTRGQLNREMATVEEEQPSSTYNIINLTL